MSSEAPAPAVSTGDTPSARVFRSESVRYLRDVYLPRLERALAPLSPEDVWWRPREEVISFGTILLHLEGNVRQWILSGLGGRPDDRDRDAEFAATDGPPPAQMLARLRDTVLAACEVIEGLDEPALHASTTIQGRETSALAAIYHVVEHFGYHTGQASWISKTRR